VRSGDGEAPIECERFVVELGDRRLVDLVPKRREDVRLDPGAGSFSLGWVVLEMTMQEPGLACVQFVPDVAFSEASSLGRLEPKRIIIRALENFIRRPIFPVLWVLIALFS